MVGAWIVSAFAARDHPRSRRPRQVRVAMIGSPGLAMGLAHELEERRTSAPTTVVGWLPTWVRGRCPGRPAATRLTLGQIREVVRGALDRPARPLDRGAFGDDRQVAAFAPRGVRAGRRCLPGSCRCRLLEATQLYEDLLGHVPLGQSNSAWFQYLLHPRYRAGATRRRSGLRPGRRSDDAGPLAPLLVAFAIAVKLTDGGSIFYRQRRVGEGGQEFEMIKLRSMREAAERSVPQVEQRPKTIG